MKILETERLLLRHMVPEDLDELYALYRDPEMRKYFPDGVLTREQTQEELEWFLNGHPEHPELGLWTTIYKPENKFVGRCGLLPWTIDGQYEVEVAYMIAKTHWGKGLGGEAAQAIVNYAFEVLKRPRIIAMMFPENKASIKTADHCGLRFEKEMVDEFGPYLIYAKANNGLEG